MDKPRICEILGVEVGERFVIQKTNGSIAFPTVTEGVCYITDDGKLLYDASNGKLKVNTVYDLINGRAKIIRKSRVTDEEKEILRAAVTLHDAKYIARNVYGCVTVHPEKPKKTESIWHDMAGNTIASKAFKLFESIKWEDEEPTLIEDLLK